MSMITPNHSVEDCHRANNKRRKIIQKLKCYVDCLQDCDRAGAVGTDDSYPPMWAVPLITYPLTKERPRYESRVAYHTVPPWEKERKSVQIQAGVVVRHCQCARRDGLQADCKMVGCKGSSLCLTKPLPLCPNGGYANQLVSPEEAARLLGRLPTPDAVGNRCIPGQDCHPECLPCTASLGDICKFIPDWAKE